MKIGLDFDRVLFDTDGFKQHLFEEIEGFDRTYSEAKQKVYSPERHAEILGISSGKIYSILEDAENFLYPDIEKLDTLEHTFIIVSRGDKKFQNIKIEKSRAIEHVDGLYIVQDDPKDVTDIDFLVDDSKEELENVDIPGFHFDREKHDINDIIKKVEELDG